MEGIEAEDFQCETRSKRDVVGMAFEPTWAASLPNNRNSTKLFPPLHVEIGLAPFCAGAFQRGENLGDLGNLQRFSPLANMKNDTDGAEKSSPQRQAWS